MAYPARFEVSGTYGFDAGLFDGYFTLTDGIKAADITVKSGIQVLNDGIKTGEVIAETVTKILTEVVKVSDLRGMTFHFSDGVKVHEPEVKLTAQKIRTDGWSTGIRIYDLLLGIFGTVWSEISTKVSSWVKKEHETDNWTKI